MHSSFSSCWYCHSFSIEVMAASNGSDIWCFGGGLSHSNAHSRVTEDVFSIVNHDPSASSGYSVASSSACRSSDIGHATSKDQSIQHFGKWTDPSTRTMAITGFPNLSSILSSLLLVGIHFTSIFSVSGHLRLRKLATIRLQSLRFSTFIQLNLPRISFKVWASFSGLIPINPSISSDSFINFSTFELKTFSPEWKSLEFVIRMYSECRYRSSKFAFE